MNDRPDGPDDSDPSESGDERGGDQGGDRRLDVDAAFEAIVANFGPTTPPPADEPETRGRLDPPGDVGRPETPDPPDPDRLRDLFRPAWDEPVEPDEDHHFVPPPPPPLPTPEPRRRLAWTGLFGGPALMLLAIVTGTALPGWVMFLLSVGFVGGFVYLVATMDDGRGRDGYDDGARV